MGSTPQIVDSRFSILALVTIPLFAHQFLMNRSEKLRADLVEHESNLIEFASKLIEQESNSIENKPDLLENESKSNSK